MAEMWPSGYITCNGAGHFIIIDGPDVVIDAISQVVRSVRNNAKLCDKLLAQSGILFKRPG